VIFAACRSLFVCARFVRSQPEPIHVRASVHLPDPRPIKACVYPPCASNLYVFILSTTSLFAPSSPGNHRPTSITDNRERRPRPDLDSTPLHYGRSCCCSLAHLLDHRLTLRLIDPHQAKLSIRLNLRCPQLCLPRRGAIPRSLSCRPRSALRSPCLHRSAESPSPPSRIRSSRSRLSKPPQLPLLPLLPLRPLRLPAPRHHPPPTSSRPPAVFTLSAPSEDANSELSGLPPSPRSTMPPRPQAHPNLFPSSPRACPTGPQTDLTHFSIQILANDPRSTRSSTIDTLALQERH